MKRQKRGETGMNETLKTIHSLRSIHAASDSCFSSKEVTREDLETILNACVRAASAGNSQSYSIIVVEDRAVIKEVLRQDGSSALIFCVDYSRLVETAKHLNRSYLVEDIIAFITGSTNAILAAQTAAIAAKSLGIDSLFTNSVHRGDVARIYKQFELPEKYCFPLIALILGYPAKEPKHPKGRVKKGVIHYGKYHKSTAEEELEEIVQEYDDPKKDFSMYGEDWKERGFAHYLDYYYNMVETFRVRMLETGQFYARSQIYAILKKAGFLESDIIRKEEKSST